MVVTDQATTAYRESSTTTEVFGTSTAGDELMATVITIDGWVGFDPGVAQAGNIGRARHRWFDTNAPGLHFEPAGCEDSLPKVLSLDALLNGALRDFGLPR